MKLLVAVITFEGHFSEHFCKFADDVTNKSNFMEHKDLSLYYILATHIETNDQDP